MGPPNPLPVKRLGVGNGWLSGDWAFRLDWFLSILVRIFSAVQLILKEPQLHSGADELERSLGLVGRVLPG